MEGTDKGWYPAVRGIRSENVHMALFGRKRHKLKCYLVALQVESLAGACVSIVKNNQKGLFELSFVLAMRKDHYCTQKQCFCNHRGTQTPRAEWDCNLMQRHFDLKKKLLWWCIDQNKILQRVASKLV